MDVGKDNLRKLVVEGAPQLEERLILLPLLIGIGKRLVLLKAINLIMMQMSRITSLEGLVTQGGMTTALELFYLFFTSEMIKSVVAHTNTYAYIKILAGGLNTYTTSHGSWEATYEAEINNLIALLIFFGLVPVYSAKEKY